MAFRRASGGCRNSSSDLRGTVVTSASVEVRPSRRAIHVRSRVPGSHIQTAAGGRLRRVLRAPDRIGDVEVERAHRKDAAGVGPVAAIRVVVIRLVGQRTAASLRFFDGRWRRPSFGQRVLPEEAAPASPVEPSQGAGVSSAETMPRSRFLLVRQPWPSASLPTTKVSSGECGRPSHRIGRASPRPSGMAGSASTTAPTADGSDQFHAIGNSSRTSAYCSSCACLLHLGRPRRQACLGRMTAATRVDRHPAILCRRGPFLPVMSVTRRRLPLLQEPRRTWHIAPSRIPTVVVGKSGMFIRLA